MAFVEEVRVIRTKRGESMAFIQLTDEDATFEMVIFPEQFRTYKQVLVEGDFVWIRAKIEERQGKKQGIVEEVKPFDFDDVRTQQTTDMAYFVQVVDMNEQQVLKTLKPLVTKYPGDTPVMLYQKETRQLFKLKPEYYLENDYAVKKQLQRLFGDDNVKQKSVSS